MSLPVARHDLFDPRNARRRHLARLLHASGPRPTFEALLDVARGRNLDETPEDFARLSPEVYRAVGAADFPQLVTIKGGRK
jgi:hypothetical protein